MRHVLDLGRGAFAGDLIVESGREFVRRRARLRRGFGAERSAVKDAATILALVLRLRLRSASVQTIGRGRSIAPNYVGDP